MIKQALVKLAGGLCLLFLSVSGWSQSANSVHFSEVKKDEANQQVILSFTTPESFIVGANRYVLHIGGDYFLKNEHPEGRLNEICFYLTPDEYANIQPGEMVLVYGLYNENIQQDNEGSQVNGFTGKHWRLGKFDPGKME